MKNLLCVEKLPLRCQKETASKPRTHSRHIMREKEWNIITLKNNFKVSARVCRLQLLTVLLPDLDHRCSRNFTYKQ